MLHFLPPVTVLSDAESVVTYSNKSRVTIFNTTKMRERERERLWEGRNETKREREGGCGGGGMRDMTVMLISQGQM